MGCAVQDGDRLPSFDSARQHGSAFTQWNQDITPGSLW